MLRLSPLFALPSWSEDGDGSLRTDRLCPDGTPLTRYAAAVGAIWGVFIGAGVMGFCLGLVTLVQIARVLTKKKGDDDSRAC